MNGGPKKTSTENSADSEAFQQFNIASNTSWVADLTPLKSKRGKNGCSKRIRSL